MQAFFCYNCSLALAELQVRTEEREREIRDGQMGISLSSPQSHSRRAPGQTPIVARLEDQTQQTSGMFGRPYRIVDYLLLAGLV